MTLLKFSKEETAKEERFRNIPQVGYRLCLTTSVSFRQREVKVHHIVDPCRNSLSVFSILKALQKKTPHFVCKSLLHCSCLCLILLYLGTASVICVVFFLEGAYLQTDKRAHVRPSVSSTQTLIILPLSNVEHISKKQTCTRHLQLRQAVGSVAALRR